MLKAVIFDVDGTLVDSNEYHTEAWQRAFEHFGINVEPDAIRKQIGKGGDQLMPVFLSEQQVAKFGAALGKFRDELYMREYMPRVQAFPRVRDLFERICEQGLKIALATSAKDKELEANKKIAKIDDLVEHETKKDDVESSKPAPDVFAAALEKLKVDADEAIAVGDTPYDAEAGNRIHLRTIGFTCGGWPEQDLRKAGCIEVYRDAADLLANFAKSSLDEGRAAA